MKNKKIGTQTVRLSKPVIITGVGAVVGPKEGECPLAGLFDKVAEDALYGEDSWEKAESKFVTEALQIAVEKSGRKMEDMDYILCGDLLNQCTGTTFGIKDFKVPYFGLFGACSTMGESMSLGAMLVDGDFANNVVVGASSHFCAAEKQFRFPLALGTQRPPSATWTVTGDGSAVLSKEGKGPVITEITTGKIIDMGVTDTMNMGAAMAPAAVNVLTAHFKDTGRQPSYYDVIATGDLGYIGKQLVIELMAKEGYEMGENFTDCGIEIFDKESQDTHAGGSGCACSAVTFTSYFYKKLMEGTIGRMLFIPTGALMSPTTSQQGSTIPGIAHGVVIESRTE